MNHTSETTETEPVPSDNVFATPGLITQPLGKNGKYEFQVISQPYSSQTIFVQ